MSEHTAATFVGDDIPPDSVYNRCVRCGLCLPHCPTYLETMVETSGPRGRIGLIRAVGEGRLDLTSPEFVHQMWECLDCRACEAVCPSGVLYGELVEKARAQIQRATAGRRTAKQRFVSAVVLRAMFANMGFLRFMATVLRFYQRSGLSAIARRSGALRALGAERMEAFAPAISTQFFIPQGQTFRVSQPRYTVFLHAGCIMHVAFAHVHQATVRLLQAAGCTVVVPRGQGCCGAIAVHAGELDEGRQLAKRNIAAFERSGADFVISNAAGCGSALKDYAEYFRDDARWHERAERFSARTRDVLEFLDEVGIQRTPRRVDGTVTYQEPCHLVHAQRIAAAPRRLLGSIPGLVLKEMPESAVCCGSAGAYNVTQPEMSERLQTRKVQNICVADPQRVVTANPGCALQVQAGLRAAGREMPVQHVVEVLDEAYSLG